MSLRIIMYYLMISDFFCHYSCSYGNPWPPIKKRIFILQKVKYFVLITFPLFFRKTTKSLIPPLKNKGWKGKR